MLEQRGMFALIFPSSLLFWKWPFSACSVMFGSLMVVWWRLKSGCCSICWVIRHIVLRRDMWGSRRKYAHSYFPSLTHLKPLRLFLYIDFCLLHSFSLLLMFVYNQSKKKTSQNCIKKRTLCETLYKVFEEHEVDNKL